LVSLPLSDAGSWYSLGPCFFFFSLVDFMFLWFDEAHYQEKLEPRKDCFRFMYERFFNFFSSLVSSDGVFRVRTRFLGLQRCLPHKSWNSRFCSILPCIVALERHRAGAYNLDWCCLCVDYKFRQGYQNCGVVLQGIIGRICIGWCGILKTPCHIWNCKWQ
jgi:hypothetical protein